MSEILLISTGGTFNKIYHPVDGLLTVDKESQALHTLSKSWLCKLTIQNIIGKDSLDITNTDRAYLAETIQKSNYKKIIVIHGTDTMEETAHYLADAKLDRTLILTGAMVPYSIDPVEATANLASAYGYLIASKSDGVYIAMHGLIKPYNHITKERKKGIFIPSS